MSEVLVSDISGYLYCPRICYFRLKFGGKINEVHAAKEIYTSRRAGFDDEWAKRKFLSLYGEENQEIFEIAAGKFIYSKSLEQLEQLDYGIVLESSRLRLKGKLDELIQLKGVRYPLILSSKAPEEGVWYRDRIKTAAFCMLLKDAGIVDTSSGLIYHCFDGELREVEIGRKDKYTVMRLVERVCKLKKGFIPEGVSDSRCTRCDYRRECSNEPVTFASRFL